MKIEKLFQYGLYLFLIGIGVVIGVAIRRYHDIPLAETINIIDVAALITTIFLAVYIPGVLDRKLEIHRDKKRLINSRVDELQYLYRKINLLVQQGGNHGSQSREIGNIIDICDSRLATIVMLIRNTEMKISIDAEMLEVIALCDEHKKLFAGHAPQDDEVENSAAFLENEERLYNDIDRAMSLIILKLSDA